MNTTLSLSFLVLAAAGSMVAQELSTIKLPPPYLAGDKPFMQTLQQRQSSRDFSTAKLTRQDLANVLWCAYGVNRPDTKHRTAPSAMNSQDIEVYAFLDDGVYLYDPWKHELHLVVAGDHRAATGSQEIVARAPLNLVYVSDFAKLKFGRDDSGKMWMASVGAGHCSQNVYLYGAAAGLSVVVRASFDQDAIAKLLILGPEKHVILAETVGHSSTN